MKRLIVNADDFGLHAAVNAGIAIGHKDGIITSTSLMAGGEAFDDAVRIAGECPHLGIGVHLTLVGGGRPVLPSLRVTTLLDGKGCFLAGYPSFIARYLAGGVKLAEVEAELAAQVEKVFASGVVPSHLDSHQHLHVLPGIFAIVKALARKYSIKALRRPAEPLGFSGGLRPSAGRVAGRAGLSLLAAWSMRSGNREGLATPEHFFGMLAGGRMRLPVFQAVMDNLPEGTSEIMTHPGMNDKELAELFTWGYHWEEELQALTSPRLRELVRSSAIQLISFREL